MRFFVLILLFVFLFGASAQKDNSSKGDVVKAKGCGHCQNSLTSCGMPGMPGSNGIPGMPGVPGLPGRVGSKGDEGDFGPQGSQGVAGTSGKLGPRGFKGSKGEAGEEGKIGANGANGANGAKGEKGNAAITDPTQRVNWKQCVWRYQISTDSGKIKGCSFNKLHQSSALRVSYQGVFGVRTSARCNRWFFKFNGSECSGPMTIEAVIYNRWPSGQPGLQYHRSFEGYCENLGRGTVSVELWVGKCPGVTPGDANTGWIAVSRIMIEEVPPSQ